MTSLLSLDVHVHPLDAVRVARTLALSTIGGRTLLVLTAQPSKDQPVPPMLDAYDLGDCTRADVVAPTPIAPTLLDLGFATGRRLLLDCYSTNAQMDLLEALRPLVGDRAPPSGPVWRQLLSATKINAAALPPVTHLPSIADVQAHVRGMKRMYDVLQAIPSAPALYETLLDLEAAYVADHASLKTAPDNFCHTVYQLHPLAFALGTNAPRPSKSSLKTIAGVCPYCHAELPRCTKDSMYLQQCDIRCACCHEPFGPETYYKTAHGTTAFNVPLRQTLSACPHKTCRHPIAADAQFRLHILGDRIACVKCKNELAYETFQIAVFIQEHPTFELLTNKKRAHVTLRIQAPGIPTDGTWATFITEVQARIAAVADTACKDGVYFFRQLIHRALVLVQANAVGAFSIDLVQAMYRQLDFVQKVCPNVEYWLNDDVLASSLVRYRQFIEAVRTKKAGEMLVPTIEIDLAWHTHMTMQQEYIRCSSKALGFVMDHDDTVAGPSLTNAFAATRALWSSTHGAAYSPYNTRDFGLFAAKDVRFAHALSHVPDNTTVVLALIGTPVFDHRTRVNGSQCDALMQASGIYTTQGPVTQGDKNVDTGCALGGCGETGLMKLLGIKHTVR
ncbi:hypothetical protein SPRG_13942 [Saprolegnia parasitica CBS 223.65]|uniref:Uncharacterized protein n=1 Tax=Saprolegnia parasitica (strain CBS 223.65) TaxID=695850 RepID=A0A067BR67_SAPPC|nr:hypothetical protein SPRG_13942 [Saprolegnia parasitica CBS 223.65]KDO21014.1 hypothetical protein SPRG_13942 [Saprolegnia parasitica CBS 223.65]|eukprot:XP_012208266.1 hypothetical protein SPRG_13942 [Saprolegnia parasitica CBS 223.65]